MPARLVALLLGIALTALACDRPAALTSDDAATLDDTESRLAWVVVYYMAYDNDLDWAATPIIRSLSAGLASDRLAVVVISDGFGPNGMARAVLTVDGAETTALPTEASAEVATLGAQLDWVSEHLPSERYALVLLDHGGRLDQIGYDTHPEPGGPDWLDLPSLAARLRDWRASLPGSFELLFLQQCGKASVENLYELSGTARYLMASEVAVGAPNAYYEGALRQLGEQPDADGLGLARSILEHEPDVMFGTYTVVEAARLAELAARLDEAIRPLVRIGSGLRGAGWDLLRNWATLQWPEGATVLVDVASPGRYLVSTLSASPVVVEIRDAEGQEVPVISQQGALGGVDRLISLTPGRYRVKVRPTDASAEGPVLVRLIPGPPLPTVWEPAPGEAFVDLTAWLESLYVANGLADTPARELRRWITEELTVARRVSAAFEDVVAADTGLSLMRPATVEVLERHADYAIFRDSQLGQLHRLLLGEAPLEAAIAEPD